MDKPKKEIVTLGTLTIDYVSPDDIKPNDYNPNRQSEHDFELLCKSIDEDGFTQPVVVNRDSRVIVDGEHRWRAAQALGLEKIPVVFVDMTEAQAKIATLRHNRARGDEDVELAAAVLKDLIKLGATDWAKDSLGLDDVEIKIFMESIDDPESMTKEQIEEIANASEEELRELVRQEGGEIEEHQTASVQDVIRAKEKALRNAKSEQERKQLAQESDVYQLRLVFTGKEGEVVRRVLGHKPIEKLLEICTEWVA